MGRWTVVIAVALVLVTWAAAEARSAHHRKRPAKAAQQQHRKHTAPRIAALHPVARQRLDAAMREMHRKGLRPRVTTAFRTRAEQQSLFSCARNKGCRARRGIYAVARPRRSLHEAGLAVDLAGVAHGTHRRRRLTHRGAQMVRIMRKHGFAWRYGLRDPAHFEVAPVAAGFRSAPQAIAVATRRWSRSGTSRPARCTQRSCGRLSG